MDITNIAIAIQSGRVNITMHARKEAREDRLLLDEIFLSTLNGEIIEDYPTDTPYPSCLVFGKTEQGNVVHSVWAYSADSRIAVLVTVYRPDPERWVEWKVRR